MSVDPLIHTSGTLDDPHSRITHDLAMCLMQLAAQVTGDPALGLHAAERVDEGDLGILEWVVMSSPTVFEAIATANRYARVIHDGAEFSLVIDGRMARWRFDLAPGLELPPIAAEYVVALCAILSRGYADDETVKGAEVHFTHAPRAAPGEYERVFGGDVRFEQASNALVLRASALARPMPRADAATKAWLERLATAMVDRLPRFDPVGPA
jgi:hypothetical protein